MGAAELLARAFHHDPFLCWAEPDAARRPRTLATIYRSLLAGAARHEACLVEPRVGSVDWKAPEHLELGPLEVLASGAWRVALVAPPAVWWRRARHEGQAMARVRAHLDARTAYLGTLGVDPGIQGLGHGGRLLERGVSAMARRWTACVLRTEQPRALPFYRRHGFELVDESVCPVSALRVWVLRRTLGQPQGP